MYLRESRLPPNYGQWSRDSGKKNQVLMLIQLFAPPPLRPLHGILQVARDADLL